MQNWQEEILKFQNSGESAVQFCKKRGLKISTFRYHLKKQQVSSGFLEILPSQSGVRFEVQYPNGVRLLIQDILLLETENSALKEELSQVRDLLQKKDDLLSKKESDIERYKAEIARLRRIIFGQKRERFQVSDPGQLTLPF